jgi:hypothetical protein
MSVIGEIHASLDAIGVEQQACVFVFLMSYPLALGGLLEARGRRVAGGLAGASALAFVLLTDPWLHAVVMVVFGVGGTGLFIAAVYVVDHVSSRIALRGLPPPELEATSEASPAQSATRERMPIGAPVSVKP